MQQQRDPRARLEVTDIRELFRRNQTSGQFNKRAHEDDHDFRILTYTSKATLDTTAGTPFFSPYNGSVAWVYASVTAAPTSTFKVDVKINAISVFDSGNLVEILSGSKIGYRRIPDRPTIISAFEDNATPITVQVDTVAGATGPMVLYIGLV